MFHNQTITEHKSILNIFKAHIEKTNSPSYIALPEDYNINQVNVYGVIGSVEESVDEDGELITKCSVSEEQNAYLCSALHDFLSTFSDKSDVLNALVDIAIYHMDYLVSEFLVANSCGEYLRALSYVKAFEHQYYSILNSAGCVFADDELAEYIVSTIPLVEYKCKQEYNNPTE